MLGRCVRTPPPPHPLVYATGQNYASISGRKDSTCLTYCLNAEHGSHQEQHGRLQTPVILYDGYMLRSLLRQKGNRGGLSVCHVAVMASCL